jgi:subtilase family serine protease
VVGVLVFLLAFQVAPVISALAQTPSAGTAAKTASPSTTASFKPEYVILGQLEGSSVFQSQRPNSVPLVEPYQFAATFYTAKDLEDAYGATSLYLSGYNGRGETIAIIDAYGDPTIYQDIATFDKDFGLPPANLAVIPVGAYEPSLGITYGWDAETALDVEAAHAMAPYAHINLVIGANASNALFEAIKLVVDDHLGNTVSMSWGLAESLYGESGWSAIGYLNYPYADYYFQQGSSQGISFFCATSDYGAYSGTLSVTGDFPSSSPFVTAVGGTALFLTPTSGLVSALNSSAAYQEEQAWSVSPQYVGTPGVSSGGGHSTFFPQPYYQSGAINSASRTYPDVAADADPYTGFVIVLEGGTYVIGGTSLSSPLWAGMAADLDQYLGRGVGLLNPYLYSIYADKTAYETAFHQVTYGFNGAYQAGPGYNLVTGLGSPNLPQLAADLKSMHQGLGVTVTTSQGPSPSAPTQYPFGNNITISADVTTPQGSPVTTGTFSVDINSISGAVASVPLSYNGRSWVGTHTVGPKDPYNSWTITVSGSSGGLSGEGIADVDIGASLGIVAPIPYPFGPPLPPNVPFTIMASAALANGTAVANANLTAHLIHSGQVISDVPLKSVKGGYYAGEGIVGGRMPQGVYILVVDGTSFGSVYTYFYVGEAVTGVLLTPGNDAIPSASPGQFVTFLAQALTSEGTGMFTSNITAKIFSLSGILMASVNLKPAPNVVQFGDYNFFTYQQANFTIPSNFTQGFYKIQFLSSYTGNSTTRTQLGNFTTGFYVSAPTLSYIISQPTTIFEGQNLEVFANITDRTGAAVTSGVFMVTAIPSGYAFEAEASDYLGYTGVPMQYNPALGQWEGAFRIPSALTSFNAFLGNSLALSSGPWTVFVSGESSAASNVVPTSSFITVLPYTFYSIASLTPSDVGTAPLVSSNSRGYSLDNIGTNSLVIAGLNVTLSSDYIGNLTITNSTVQLIGSHVGSVSASGSTLALLDGTQVGSLNLTSTPLTARGSTYTRLSPALPTIAVAGLSASVSSFTGFTVTVIGDQLSSSSLVATVDGGAIPLVVSLSSSGLTAMGTVNATSLADGVHTLVIEVRQSDGLSTSLTTAFSTNAQATALSGKVTSLTNEANSLINKANSLTNEVSTLFDIVYLLGVIAVVAFVVASIAVVRNRSKAPPLAAST